MLQAMLAGVASIKAQQTRMNVIGNNLANVNTAAFKGSRVTFQDMLSQTIRGASRPTGGSGGTNPIQFGLGVLVAGTDTNNEQGSLNATNRPTDMAIQGNGYFMTSDGQKVAYTRDGGFDLDANGDLVHRATGEKVLGWNFINEATQDTNSVITPDSSLNIPLGRLNASKVTTTVNFQGNLDGEAEVGNYPGHADPNKDKVDWSTHIQVFDSLGGAHKVRMDFFDRANETPTAGGFPAGNDDAVSSWRYRAVLVADDGTETVLYTTPPGSGAPYSDERLYFNANGEVTEATKLAQHPVTIPVPSGGGPLNFDIELNFSEVGQLKADSQLGMINQDGFPPGALQAFSVDANGIITGLFTNGLTQPLGRIAVAIFPNPGGLERTGNNQWRATDNSGVPNVGTPRTGGRGQVNSGFLEQSNVDIGAEFTDLIVTQRGFQANTRVVTTVDEMLQDLINMKR